MKAIKILSLIFSASLAVSASANEIKIESSDSDIHVFANCLSCSDVLSAMTDSLESKCGKLTTINDSELILQESVVYSVGLALLAAFDDSNGRERVLTAVSSGIDCDSEELWIENIKSNLSNRI